VVVVAKNDCLVVILRVHLVGKPDLLQVGEACRRPGFLAGVGEDREEDRRQDGDDRYHYEQLDQCEGTSPLHGNAQPFVTSPSILDRGSRSEPASVPGNCGSATISRGRRRTHCYVRSSACPGTDAPSRSRWDPSNRASSRGGTMGRAPARFPTCFR